MAAQLQQPIVCVFNSVTFEVPVRPLPRREMDEIDIRIVEMTTPDVLAAVPGQRYKDLLEECICGVGGYRLRDFEDWTSRIWSHEFDVGLVDQDVLQHEIDILMTGADLARLGYFIHHNDDNLLMRELKRAWKRITMAEVQSMFALWPGQTCLVTYHPEGIEFARMNNYSHPNLGPHERILNVLRSMNTVVEIDVD